MRLPVLAVLVLFGMQLIATDASAQSAEPIAAVRWLTGWLEARNTTRVVEQQRMPLSAGTMLGMGRTTNARGLADCEHDARDDTAHRVPLPARALPHRALSR